MPLVPRHALILLTAIAAALAAGPGLAHAQALFPYVAYVVDQNATVHSGPAERYYPTDQLSLGYAVEVYRHDADGMCAIRPPEGSFSLIPARNVRVLDARSAELVADYVASSAGSRLGPQHSAVQVLLRRGETVELLAPIRNGAPWIRIAPPAGEFRWISARHIARTPPTETAAVPDALTSAESRWRPLNGAPFPHSTDESEGSEALALLRRRERLEATRAAQPNPLTRQAVNNPAVDISFDHLGAASNYEVIVGSPAELQQVQLQQVQYQQAQPKAESPPFSATGSTAPRLANATDGKSAPSDVGDVAPSVAPAPEALSAVVPPQPANPTALTPPRIRFPGISMLGSMPGTTHLPDLEFLLSQIVVQPPITWQLTGLRVETSAQLAVTTDPIQRAGLRDLLERIAVFEQVQRRYIDPQAAWTPSAASGDDPFGPGSVPGGAVPDSSSPSLPAFTSESTALRERVRQDLDNAAVGLVRSPTTPVEATAPPATEARYDAVGTLKPVSSMRPGAPRFALVDDDGNVVSFLTAGPELNLQAYVGQRIGVAGTRGFMPEYRQAHVVAGRVTPLVR